MQGSVLYTNSARGIKLLQRVYWNTLLLLHQICFHVLVKEFVDSDVFRHVRCLNCGLSFIIKLDFLFQNSARLKPNRSCFSGRTKTSVRCASC